MKVLYRVGTGSRRVLWGFKGLGAIGIGALGFRMLGLELGSVLEIQVQGGGLG